MVMALAEACERLGFRYGLALEYTAGSFYLGQGRPLGDEPDSYWPSGEGHHARHRAAGRQGARDGHGRPVYHRLSASACRIAAVLSVVAARKNNNFAYNNGEEKACLAASEALKILKEWDERGEFGR